MQWRADLELGNTWAPLSFLHLRCTLSSRNGTGSNFSVRLEPDLPKLFFSVMSVMSVMSVKSVMSVMCVMSVVCNVCQVTTDLL